MWIITLISLLLTTSIYASTNHEIQAFINPATHSLSVQDKITLPEFNCNQDLIVSLHADLNPKTTSPTNAKLIYLKSEIVDEIHNLKIDYFKLKLPCNTHSAVFEYNGVIYHPVTDPDSPYSRGTSDSPGLINNEGVVISSGTYWYPKFENLNDQYVSFSLKASMPDNWVVVSQGEKLQQNSWIENSPQQDIYLIAAKFTEYEKILADGKKINVYLRTKDDEMAQNYLDVSSVYIDRYSNLIGPYPYSKFALVENFWDTGFGMPSFTLLGSNIIRLPFIINTSYPHEILHNWWGNSVYVNTTLGNWCEGITAYMADHLMAELSSSGDIYRRDTLQKYADFVTAKNDFPLNKFAERHDAASEAIGYGKSLMFFHMLRQRVGDINFKKVFSEFYAKNIFSNVSFKEIQKSFESLTQLNLTSTFSQWVDRKGAPCFKISEVTSGPSSAGFLFHAKIEQTQSDEIFNIDLPVAIHLEGEKNANQLNIKINSRVTEINLVFNQRASWFQVDPEFDIFRRLSKDEVPPVLTMALGSPRTLMILPSSTPPQTLSNWKNFITFMTPALPKESDIQILLDSEVTSIPNDRAIWVLGKENNFTQRFNELIKEQNASLNETAVMMNGVETPFENHSFTMIGRDPKNNNQIWTFVATDSDGSFLILANKLIHYGKYSYLGFENETVTNKTKGIWKLLSSSMSVPVVQTDGAVVDRKLGQLTKRSALVTP